MAVGIRKGDQVIVIAGKNKDARGRVLKVLPATQRVIVEGVNMIKRHTKPSQRNQQGGIMEKEAAIHISNVMLIDPKTGERTRFGSQGTGKGDRVRIAKKSNQQI